MNPLVCMCWKGAEGWWLIHKITWLTKCIYSGLATFAFFSKCDVLGSYRKRQYAARTKGRSRRCRAYCTSLFTFIPKNVRTGVSLINSCVSFLTDVLWWIIWRYSHWFLTKRFICYPLGRAWRGWPSRNSRRRREKGMGLFVNLVLLFCLFHHIQPVPSEQRLLRISALRVTWCL